MKDMKMCSINNPIADIKQEIDGSRRFIFIKKENEIKEEIRNIIIEIDHLKYQINSSRNIKAKGEIVHLSILQDELLKLRYEQIKNDLKKYNDFLEKIKDKKGK